MTVHAKNPRPATPFTPKVLENIEAKANKLLSTFKVFKNKEKEISRRNDIVGRLKAEVMKAYAKFRPNDRCSYESYVDMYLASAGKHFVRDFVRQLGIERATLPGDAPVDGEDGESPTFLSAMEDPAATRAGQFTAFDVAEVIEELRRRSPRYATIMELHLEGRKFSEIHKILGVPDWELYDNLWPAAKAAFREIYEFHR